MGLRDAFGLGPSKAELQEALQEALTVASEATRELGLLGYTLVDFTSGNTHDLKQETRVSWAQKSRVAWMSDPMAGAAVDLMNDFVFGRGVPKPRAKDEQVQEVIDEFWDDPDNKRTLTTYEAQMALGVDMTCQSNVFVLMFDDGDDGKVKLALLSHDDVKDAVTDPDNKQRVLYFLAKHRRVEWDFERDCVKIDLKNEVQGKTLYYEHWQVATEPEDYDGDLPKPPKDKQGEGRVYHMRFNRTTEMIFGVPTMQRTLRWFNAYNEFMASRVDMTKAAAAFVMKRKAKATPNQLAKIGSKAISRASDLAAATGTGDSPAQIPPRTGAIINENENLTHEAFRIPSGAGEASQDALMLRAQVSAATRFPQHYLGDAGSANLATATAMELPVLKAVESRQELFEQLFRWGIDRAIERAVESGRITKTVTPEEAQADVNLASLPGPELAPEEESALAISAAYEDQTDDEKETERDLSYEFSMPNPLRRLLTDLVGAAAQTAQVFDPNGTNIELSRILLTIILGEGFELEDPASAVEAIFPEGYQDPAILAAQEQARAMQASADAAAAFAQQGPPQSAGSRQLGGDTTYGAKGGAVPAERQPIMQSLVIRDREGNVLREVPINMSAIDALVRQIEQGYRLADGDERVRAAVVGRDRLFEDDYTDLEADVATALGELAAANGRGA
jgi:hypothetical protein